MDRLKHTVRTLSDCHNISDFRALAKRRLPYPEFHARYGRPDFDADPFRPIAP